MVSVHDNKPKTRNGDKMGLEEWSRDTRRDMRTWKEEVLLVGVVRLLVGADDEPDAGQPVGDEGERHHQQGQDHHAVLRISARNSQKFRKTFQRSINSVT